MQFWGNNSGLPGQLYLDSGAHNSAALIFRTTTTGGTITERMRVAANGNVGIGTTAPLAKLDVRGDVFVGLTVAPDTALGDNLYIANTGGDSNNSFRLDGFANNLYVVARSGAGSRIGASIVFRTAPAGGGETDRMIIDQSGRVGIGTNVPLRKLHVDGGDEFAAVYGNSTGFSGVEGNSTSGVGVGGRSSSGTGVFGSSNSGTGVIGSSSSGNLFEGDTNNTTAVFS